MSRTHTCAFVGCEETMAPAPYARFKLPPFCIRLMKNRLDVDESEIYSPVRVDLCERCIAIAKRMLSKYNENPICECDAKLVRYDGLHELQTAAAWNDSRSVDELKPDMEELSASMIRNAELVVAIDERGKAGHILDSKVIANRAILRCVDDIASIGDPQ